MTDFDRSPWLGSWENFELYYDDPELQPVWALAEETVRQKKKNLVSRWLFRRGAKAFWQSACYTVTAENPSMLGGWTIGPSGEQDVTVAWRDAAGQLLGSWTYLPDSVVENGLEKKPCILLRAARAPEGCPFRWLLLMPPMPPRSAKSSGGLISHLHFQFSSQKEGLVTARGRLKHPHWYATMCDSEVTPAQRRGILRALHGLPEEQPKP